jgi:hypothetical protein
MSIVTTVKNISLVSCEKNSLIRHALLLPKIVHPYPSRSSACHFVAILAPVVDQDRHKKGQQGSFAHLFIDRKTKKMGLKLHSLWHAA